MIARLLFECLSARKEKYDLAADDQFLALFGGIWAVCSAIFMGNNCFWMSASLLLIQLLQPQCYDVETLLVFACWVLDSWSSLPACPFIYLPGCCHRML